MFPVYLCLNETLRLDILFLSLENHLGFLLKIYVSPYFLAIVENPIFLYNHYYVYIYYYDAVVLLWMLERFELCKEDALLDVWFLFCRNLDENYAFDSPLLPPIIEA